MTFLNSNLLYLLPLALIPVIIHLLNRLRYKRISWAAMEFLIASRRKTIKRSRLKNFLLLAARVLALVLLVAAVARPVATGGLLASVFVGGSGNRLIVIDNSLSMSLVSHGRTNLDRALEVAEAALGFGGGGGTGVKIASLVQPRGEITFNALSADTDLQVTIPQTDGGGDIVRSLSYAAKEAEASGKHQAEILLVCDMQRSDWSPEDTGAWTRVREELFALGKGASVRIIDVGEEAPMNAAVTEVSFSESVLVPGRTVRITADLIGSGVAGSSTVASLFLDGDKVSSASVDWTDEMPMAACSFDVRVAPDMTAGRIELGEDSLPADSSRYFVISPCARIAVLCLDGRYGEGELGGACGFISAALDPESGPGNVPNSIASQVASWQEGRFALTEYSVVILAGVSALSVEFTEEVRTFVERGGMAMVFLGEEAEVSSYSSPSTADLLPSFPLRIRKSDKEGGIPIASVDYSVSALEQFDNPDNPQIHDVKVWKWWEMDVSEDDSVRTLLALQDGSPWLVQRNLGRGQVLVFASPCDASWSSMPVSPSFLPLLHRLVLSFFSGSLPETSLTAGALLGPSSIASARKEYEVAFPSGKTGVYRAGAAEAQCADTLHSGIYGIRMLPDGSGELRAINPPVGESMPARIGEEEIRGLLRGIRVSVVETEKDSPGSAQEGWPLAAAAVLLFLVAEIFLARAIDRG